MTTNHLQSSINSARRGAALFIDTSAGGSFDASQGTSVLTLGGAPAGAITIELPLADDGAEFGDQITVANDSGQIANINQGGLILNAQAAASVAVYVASRDSSGTLSWIQSV